MLLHTFGKTTESKENGPKKYHLHSILDRFISITIEQKFLSESVLSEAIMIGFTMMLFLIF